MGKIYYWDSSVFCAYFNKEKISNRYALVKPFLEEAESGEVTIATSYMTITETLRVDNEKPKTEAKQRIIVDFLKKDYFEWVSFDRAIAENARSLIWRNSAKLKSKDAVHLASALWLVSKGVLLDAIHTYDGDFSDLIGLDALRCPIGPPLPDQLSLDLEIQATRRPRARRVIRRKPPN